MLWLSGLAASVLSILAVGAWLVGDAAAAPPAPGGRQSSAVAAHRGLVNGLPGWSHQVTGLGGEVAI